MSTRNGVSAFGVLHKSEYEPGKFKPAAQLTADERNGVGRVAVARRLKPVTRATPANRGLSQVYEGHAFASRSSHSALNNSSLKRDFDQSTHTPSATHKKIAYGPSATPEMRASLDSHIDPKIAGKLRHTVVLHHKPTLQPGIAAAAIGAHRTSGGRGHVAIGGAQYDPNGRMAANGPRAKQAGMSDVVNHELVHASRHKAPKFAAATTVAQNLGEEARADAVSGTHLYTRTGAVPKSSSATRRAIGAFRQAGGEITNPGGAQALHRYHKVKGLIRVASKGKV